MQTSAQRSPARKDPAARTVQDPWAADQSRHWRDGDAQTANVNCARVEKRRTADLATEQQTASRPEQDLTAEVKIKQLRQLFADAPEVGKTVLENVLQRFASDASKAPPLPVQSAGRGQEPAGQCLRPDWAGGRLLILHSMRNRTLGSATRCRCFPAQAGTR
jgi:hypothetical protein